MVNTVKQDIAGTSFHCIILLPVVQLPVPWFYQRLVSFTLLLIQFAHRSSVKFITELNSPTAELKLKLNSIRPLRYT